MLRQMIGEYKSQEAVSRWLGSKWRGVVIAVAGLSSVAVLTASAIQIAGAVS